MVCKCENYGNEKNLRFDTFDWEFYIGMWSDLRAAGILTQKSAWIHWEKYGHTEWRYARSKKIGNPPSSTSTRHKNMCVKNPCLKINKNTWKVLKNHFNTCDMEFVLVGVTETLNTDLSHDISKKMESEGGDIRHYDTGSDNFNGLPLEVQAAVKAVNDLNLYAFVKGLGYVRHVIGTVTFADEVELKKAGFGFTASIYGYPTKIYGSLLTFLDGSTPKNRAMILGYLPGGAGE